MESDAADAATDAVTTAPKPRSALVMGPAAAVAPDAPQQDATPPSAAADGGAPRRACVDQNQGGRGRGYDRQCQEDPGQAVDLGGHGLAQGPSLSGRVSGSTLSAARDPAQERRRARRRPALIPWKIPAPPQAARRDRAADAIRAGARRRSALLLVAARLLFYLALAQGNPWGLAVDGDANQATGARDRRPPDLDWIQSTKAPTGAARGSVSGESAPGQSGLSPGAGRAADQPPLWSGGWSGAGAAGPSGQTQGPSAGADRFRTDIGATDPAAVTRGWPPGSAPVPTAADAGYRYHGDPPQPGDAGGWPAPGAYRFRPLTERERARQGQGAGPRSIDQGQAQHHPSGTPPAWPPGAVPDDEAGPWPSR